MEFAAAEGFLSPEELPCIGGEGGGVDLRPLLAMPHLATPGQQTRVVACMNDETLLRFYLGSLTSLERLGPETSDCIREGTAGLDLRSVMGASPGGDEQAVMARCLAAASVETSCLSDAEFALAATALGMGPRDREVRFCVVEAMGGPVS